MRVCADCYWSGRVGIPDSMNSHRGVVTQGHGRKNNISTQPRYGSKFLIETESWTNELKSWSLCYT